MAVIALLVLNVILIYPLLTGASIPFSTLLARVPNLPHLPGGHPTSAAPQSSSSPDPHDGDSQPGWLLANDSDQIAWRAKPADCHSAPSGAGTIEVTSDGGKTWQSSDPGLSTVVGLVASGASGAIAIGADKNCKPAYVRIDAPDGHWQQDKSALDSAWYVTPGDLNTVHEPHGSMSKPCDTLGLVNLAAVDNKQAAVLCSDGSVRTRVGGQDWTKVKAGPGVVAISASPKRFVMASQLKACNGLSIRRFELTSAGLNLWRPQCAKLPHVDPTAVAVGLAHGSTWVWSGDVAEPYQ